MLHRLSLILLLASCKGPHEEPQPDIYIGDLHTELDGTIPLDCSIDSVDIVWTFHSAPPGLGTIRATNLNPELGTLEVFDDRATFTRGDDIGEASIEVCLVETPEMCEYPSIPIEGRRATAVGPDDDYNAAIQELCPGGTVTLAAGVYEQRLPIHRSMLLTGPDTDPPTAIIRPTEAYVFGPLAVVDPPPDSAIEVTVRNLTLDGAGVDDIPYQPESYRWFSGMHVNDANTSVNLENVHFENIRDPDDGHYNGIGLKVEGATVSVDDCTFDNVGYRAIDTRGTDELAAGHVDVSNSLFIGSDPATGDASVVQYGITLWDDVGGTISGNTFRDFGPALPVTPDGTRVTPDTDVGYAVELRGQTGSAPVSVTGNHFENVQGIYFDDRLFTDPDNALRANTWFTDNTVDGHWLAAGLLPQSSRLHGQRDDDPDQFNSLLSTIACINYSPCAVTLSAGTYTLASPLVDPGWDIELHASGGDVVIETPDGVLPSTVLLTGGVTLEQSTR